MTLYVDYDDRVNLRTMIGTINPDGSISGTWSDENLDHGNWLTVAGVSVTSSCSWTDFVKIVAVPSNAVLSDSMWFSADGTEIGPLIWGEFAIIQEISTDPCGQDVDLMDYKSQLRSGLGNW